MKYNLTFTCIKYRVFSYIHLNIKRSPLMESLNEKVTDVKDLEASKKLNVETFPEDINNGVGSNSLDSEKEYMDIDEEFSFEVDKMKNNLLRCVASGDGFFKSQQVGEKDLTYLEKWEIASNLLKENKPLFLQRYWKFIKVDDIPFFDTYRSNYEVNFYLTEIIKSHNSKNSKIRVKNRRYEALKKMVEEGSYFSDAEMKRRSPFLYHQMIGQHLTENERIAAYREQHPDEKFSAFLMSQLEKNEENYLFKKEQDENEAIVEEEDDDTSEEESELEDDEPTTKVVITEEEKRLFRSEFTNIMYENFLDGKDRDFDYSLVDNNVEYDSVQQRDIDEEEKYFDESSDSGD